ncbi:MAG: glycosyltransferase family 25 protein [Chlamydiales bacterium]|jgi:GR25 family glycosyltransferase involved in LPS biosynthesis|nr:glycosyltransferase family 25 protein [Chlamydiales bacterium]
MNNIILCLSFLFFLPFSYGALQDHLKHAEEKGNDHKIRNIDFIYIINLDKRPEKYALSKQYLKKYEINPFRFSAINGWELPIEVINDVGVKYQPDMTPLLSATFIVEEGVKIRNQEFMKEYGKTYFCPEMSLGAVGCALSHISVLQDAYDSNYETIWIMEDDIEVLSNPHRLSDLIDELDNLVGSDHWDVLFTDYDQRIDIGKYMPHYGLPKRPDLDDNHQKKLNNKCVKATQVSDHFRKIEARFGTVSRIIRRSGIIKLLEFAKTHNFYLHYDGEIYFPPGIQHYGLTFDLVTNMLNSLSDIKKENN